MLSSLLGCIFQLQVHSLMPSLNSGVMNKVCSRLFMQQVAPIFGSPLQFFQAILNQIYIMKNKLPKKKQLIKVQPQHEELVKSQEEEEENQVQEVQFIAKMLKKEALFVTFTGTLETGFFQEEDSLTASCTIMHGADWIKVCGQKNFVSQIASSNGNEITWNLPFEITFETTYLTGWPQLVIVFYGTDFFGRPFVKGYGNMHLPSRTGKQTRKMRIFKPLPQSTISGIFGFIGGVLAQYKDHQKILSSGDGREVTRVKSMGQVTISVETVKYNFKKYGYQ